MKWINKRPRVICGFILGNIYQMNFYISSVCRNVWQDYKIHFEIIEIYFEIIKYNWKH